MIQARFALAHPIKLINEVYIHLCTHFNTFTDYFATCFNVSQYNLVFCLTIENLVPDIHVCIISYS